MMVPTASLWRAASYSVPAEVVRAARWRWFVAIRPQTMMLDILIQRRAQEFEASNRADHGCEMADDHFMHACMQLVLDDDVDMGEGNLNGDP